MKKEIKIDKDNKFEINTGFGWLYKYREYFGEDILPQLVPLIESTAGIAIETLDGDETADPREILGEAMATFAGTEITTLTNVIWALAKNADESIPKAEDWFNQFDKFPVDKILPEIFFILADTFVSTKKAQSLKDMMKATGKKAASLPTK